MLTAPELIAQLKATTARDARTVEKRLLKLDS